MNNNGHEFLFMKLATNKIHQKYKESLQRVNYTKLSEIQTEVTKLFM